MQDRRQNPGRISTAGILPGNVVQVGGIASHVDTLGEFGQLLGGNRLLADLTAPAIHIREVAAGVAPQRNHTHIGLFAVLALDAERGGAHLAGRLLLPAAGQSPAQLRLRRRSHAGMPGGHFRLLLHRRRGVLVLLHPIDLDFIAPASGEERNRRDGQRRPAQRIMDNP